MICFHCKRAAMLYDGRFYPDDSLIQNRVGEPYRAAVRAGERLHDICARGAPGCTCQHRTAYRRYLEARAAGLKVLARVQHER